MRLITVSGPPSSGKTSVILKTLACLPQGTRPAVVKFDCLSTYDDERYKKAGIADIKLGISGSLCPDHFYVSNVHDCVRWGVRKGFDYLICESAGLCNRCSPHIKGVLAVCVIDVLSGVDTPKKIGPMLKLADVVAVTKGDIVSQAEREVFAFRVAQANPRADILFINGLTGQGAFGLSQLFQEAAHKEALMGEQLRFSMPAAMCTFCYGETVIRKGFRTGNITTMDFRD